MIHEVSEFKAFTSAVGGASKPPRWAAAPVAFAVHPRFGATDGDITATHRAQTFPRRDRHATPTLSGSPCGFLTDSPQILRFCSDSNVLCCEDNAMGARERPRRAATMAAALPPPAGRPGTFSLASLTSAATPVASLCGCCGQTASTGRVCVCLIPVFVSPGLFSIRPLDKCEHHSWMLKLHLFLCCDTGDFFWITNKLDPVTDHQMSV